MYQAQSPKQNAHGHRYVVLVLLSVGETQVCSVSVVKCGGKHWYVMLVLLSVGGNTGM
jgi:6-pyruvoyl-tetrahydropterin synthase